MRAVTTVTTEADALDCLRRALVYVPYGSALHARAVALLEQAGISPMATAPELEADAAPATGRGEST